jgi:hypothetical protein
MTAAPTSNRADIGECAAKTSTIIHSAITRRRIIDRQHALAGDDTRVAQNGRVCSSMRQLTARLRGDRFGWAIVLVLVIFRSAVFVLRPEFAFDSDQAVWGLMAKHVAEGRAFPLFMYGQNYMLALEAWVTAVVFLVTGVSAIALKIPILAINVAIAFVLLHLLRGDAGLETFSAVVASLFFTLTPPGTAETVMEASGGTVEPVLYVLLLWMLRRRPIWFGVVLGVGFLQREFTMYGAVALGILALARGDWRRKEEWRRAGQIVRTAAEVWFVAQFLRQFSSPFGPGTTAVSQLPGNNVTGAMNKFCFDFPTVLQGFGRLVTVHWPRLFGTERLPVGSFGTESAVIQGAPWSGALLAAVMVLMAGRVVAHSRTDKGASGGNDFCTFLILVGILSATVFAVSRCGDVSVMRYDVLSILGAVGLAALALRVESRLWIRRLEIAAVIAWAMVSATAHVAVWVEQLSHPRVPDKVLIVRHLDARGIRYAISDYWIAYYVTFFTNERIIVAAGDAVRIFSYENTVAAHRREAIRISRTPCGDARPVIQGVYFCAMP